MLLLSSLAGLYCQHFVLAFGIFCHVLCAPCLSFAFEVLEGAQHDLCGSDAAAAVIVSRQVMLAFNV